ncbi:hypothetical protein INT48_005971, partial [Thamnidium elegans]
MITTTRERVICMFYHQGYNDTKAIELLNAIEKLDLEICYKDNLCKPFLLYTNSIKAGPYNNHIYQKTTKTPERNNQIGKFLSLWRNLCKSDCRIINIMLLDNVIEDIVSHLPRYQRFIQSLKDEGYHVIGYVRKCICEKDDDPHVRLLNLMCKNLKNRSLVSKVFASVYCNANEPLLERDLNKQKIILPQIHADGDMPDLKVFLKNNPNIKKLMIDRFSSCDASHIYDTQELLNDSDKIKVFNYRKKTQQSQSRYLIESLILFSLSFFSFVFFLVKQNT